MLVDLHLHSQFSDGSMTPEEIAARGKERGYGVLALADHNQYGSWERFSKACRELGIFPIRGMEMDCLYAGFDLHILAYRFEPNERLKKLAAHSAQLLLDMSDDLLKKLIPEYPQLNWESYRSYPFDRSLGGWQALHYLVSAGVAEAPEDAMHLYGKYGCDYKDYPFPPAAEVIDAIHEAGGYAVLAHPGNWFAHCTEPELTGHFDALRKMGLDGIECYYPAHSAWLVDFCTAYCKEHRMLITTGSDFHGRFCFERHGIVYDMGILRLMPENLRITPLMDL